MSESVRGSQQAVPNSSGIEPPKLHAPANAADCHIHIYDPRFQPRVEKPASSAVEDYRLLQKRIGLTRVVIVTPRNYVTDNSVTLDAIRQLGADKARGVGVLRPTVTDAELKTLHDGGIRGIRFTVGQPKTAVVTIDMIEPLAKRIADFGWHVQLNMEPIRSSKTRRCCADCRLRSFSIIWGSSGFRGSSTPLST